MTQLQALTDSDLIELHDATLHELIRRSPSSHTLEDHAQLHGMTLAELARLSGVPLDVAYRINRNPSSARMLSAVKLGGPINLKPGEVRALRRSDAHPTRAAMREARIERGMTQRQLAKLLDVTPTAVCQFENGSRTPSPRTPKAIKEHLNL